MGVKDKSQTILKFEKNAEGVSVTLNSPNALDVLIGIAQTIQMITEETKENRESILGDINKILDVLEEEN